MTTFGESQGPALGCVIDGCPAGLVLDESEIQRILIDDVPGSLVTPVKDENRTRSRFCLESLREKQRVCQ